MRMIEADKVIPLMRLLLLFDPKADIICRNMQDIVDIHTIDAEPVLRCKDCVDWNAYGGSMKGQGECKAFDNYCYITDEDDFCSFGERKETT